MQPAADSLDDEIALWQSGALNIMTEKGFNLCSVLLQHYRKTFGLHGNTGRLQGGGEVVSK